MRLYEEIVSGKEKLSLVGLGYVGMPIAVAFAKKRRRLIFINLVWTLQMRWEMQ